MSQKTFDLIAADVEEAVSWERGPERAWECDGIIGAEYLTSLVRLASYAPADKRELFLKGDLYVRE